MYVIVNEKTEDFGKIEFTGSKVLSTRLGNTKKMFRSAPVKTNGQTFHENREARLAARKIAVQAIINPLVEDIKKQIATESASDVTQTAFVVDVVKILTHDGSTSNYYFNTACGPSKKELLHEEWIQISNGVLSAFANQDVTVYVANESRTITFNYADVPKLIEERLAREKAAKEDAERIAKEKAEQAAKAAAEAEAKKKEAAEAAKSVAK